MTRILIAAAATLAWIASIVMLPFITHHAKHLIITANAVALGGDAPTWVIGFADLVGVWCFGATVLVGGYGAISAIWLFWATKRERGTR